MTERGNLTYNTEQEKLLFKEYGRNVLKLVQSTIKLETKKERTAAAKEIVNLMAQLHPNLKNVEEFRHKLWDQLHAIADFKLDIDSPYPAPESYDQIMQQAGEVPYPSSRIKLKHYGKNIEALVQRAIATDDERKKAELIRIIVYYMNLVHITWNKDLNVSEDLIKHDLNSLSKGLLDHEWAEKYLASKGVPKPMVIPIQQMGNNQNKQGQGNVLKGQQQGQGQPHGQSSRRRKKKNNRKKNL
ncbi:MAG: DUF4290 domain-containing protein [Sphingobacteriales bacterium]|nr:MAG: DUF4290 domain-containing protein [Sphingobacteriales bacterium]